MEVWKSQFCVLGISWLLAFQWCTKLAWTWKHEVANFLFTRNTVGWEFLLKMTDSFVLHFKKLLSLAWKYRSDVDFLIQDVLMKVWSSWNNQHVDESLTHTRWLNVDTTFDLYIRDWCENLWKAFVRFCFFENWST